MPLKYRSEAAVDALLLEVRGQLLLCDVGSRPADVAVDYAAAGTLRLSGERLVSE